MKALFAVGLAGCLMLLGSCSVVTNMTTAKATFVVAVKNDSSEPIRIGLAKDGPPFEEAWASPEEIAIGDAHNSNASWGQTVLPGQKAVLEPIEGRFADHVHGFVRVYAGDPSLSEMLAISRRSPSRLDLPLAEGLNRFVVLDSASGSLEAKRLPNPPPPAPEKK